MRVEGVPGLSIAGPYAFNITRGIFENLTERDTVAALSPSDQAPQIDNTYDVFNAAAVQGIGFTDITLANLANCDALNISGRCEGSDHDGCPKRLWRHRPRPERDAQRRPTVAWAEVNLATGEYIGVDANGGHQAAFEFLALVGEDLGTCRQM